MLTGNGVPGMDDDEIKHAEVTSEGLIVTFKDGREGLIRGEHLRDCVEKTDGFAKVAALQVESAED
jgi:hypothetical protein